MAASKRDTASSLSCLLDPPTGDDAETKVCRPAGGGHKRRTVLRWYEGRVRNPSYQRNLFNAQPPVGRGWAVRWRSTAMVVRRSSCRARSSLSHWACRWPRLPVMPHPYNHSCLRCRRHVKLTPARQPNLTPWSGGLALTESGGPEGNVVCGRLGRDSSVASGGGVPVKVIARPTPLDESFSDDCPPQPAMTHLIVPSLVGTPVATTRVATSSSTEARPSRLASP